MKFLKLPNYYFRNDGIMGKISANYRNNFENIQFKAISSYCVIPLAKYFINSDFLGTRPWVLLTHSSPVL